jgi:hypothetical protein
MEETFRKRRGAIPWSAESWALGQAFYVKNWDPQYIALLGPDFPWWNHTDAPYAEEMQDVRHWTEFQRFPESASVSEFRTTGSDTGIRVPWFHNPYAREPRPDAGMARLHRNDMEARAIPGNARTNARLQAAALARHLAVVDAGIAERERLMAARLERLRAARAARIAQEERKAAPTAVKLRKRGAGVLGALTGRTQSTDRAAQAARAAVAAVA